MSKKKIKFGDNTYPNYVTQSDKGNGRKDYFFGEKGKSHGHTVTKNGKIIYARTPRGEVRVDKNPKPKKSGGCFITTATCQTLGKSDNCFELNTFRNYRDNWLINQEGGEQLIEKYYKVAPIIVQNIQSKLNHNLIFKNIWDDYLIQCLKFINDGEYEKAKKIYISMVESLSGEFEENNCKNISN